MYSEECKRCSLDGMPRPYQLTHADRDAMDYFRAIVAAEEHSERALELTEMIIRKNPAHYTVWRVLLEDAVNLFVVKS